MKEGRKLVKEGRKEGSKFKERKGKGEGEGKENSREGRP